MNTTPSEAHSEFVGGAGGERAPEVAVALADGAARSRDGGAARPDFVAVAAEEGPGNRIQEIFARYPMQPRSCTI